MKRTLTAGLIAILLASLAAEASAQPDDRRAPGGERPGGGKPGGPGPGRPEPGKPDRPNPGRPEPGKPNPGRPEPGRPGGDHRPPPRPNPSKPPPRLGRPSPRPPGNRPGRYPLGAYRRPPGYFLRQWAIGATLPSFFRARGYWIASPGLYGLRPPPPGTRWIRVDDDALLVSNRTGRVIDVVRNIFY